MRLTISAALAFLMAGAAVGQERIPPEEAQKIAATAGAAAAKLADLPFKTDVDADKPFGLHKDKHGGMVVPRKGLTADQLAKADQGIVPLGQLWFLNVAPGREGEALDKDKMRLVEVTHKDETHKLVLCLLGVRKNQAGELQLLVFGKGKEPLLTLPLNADSGSLEMPIELDGQRIDDGSAFVTLRVLGKYRARMTVTLFEP